jgi:two-component system, sensor histidine kinase and response regulator
VPDLDVEGALARMLGRKSLYLELLLRYVNTQREVPAQVRAALDTGDTASALRLAHTAKGLAATIGATRVAGRSAALEEYLRPPHDPAQVEAAMEDLDAALEDLFAALSESLAALARAARAAGDKP